MFQKQLGNISNSNNDLQRIVEVDGKTFREFFKTNKNYLKNGETVDLLDPKDYEKGTTYMSNDGLSGFFIYELSLFRCKMKTFQKIYLYTFQRMLF